MEKAKAANHSRAGFFPNPELKSFEQVREVIRFEHYSVKGFFVLTSFSARG